MPSSRPPKSRSPRYTRDQLASSTAITTFPADSLLIVVGDFAADAMLDKIEKIFGAWKAPQPEPPMSPEPPQQSGRRVHLVHMPGTVQTQVVLGNLAITRRDPDWYRLLLANSIYGGAFHSRLVMNIREQKGYTYSPRSGVNALRQHGYFTVQRRGAQRRRRRHAHRNVLRNGPHALAPRAPPKNSTARATI